MKARTIALALTAGFLAAAPTTSEARIHLHYGYCSHFLHYDYSHGNALSAISYIYPAANWGPFFQCHMYSTPVLVLPLPAPY